MIEEWIDDRIMESKKQTDELIDNHIGLFQSYIEDNDNTISKANRILIIGRVAGYLHFAHFQAIAERNEKIVEKMEE